MKNKIFVNYLPCCSIYFYQCWNITELPNICIPYMYRVIFACHKVCKNELNMYLFASVIFVIWKESYCTTITDKIFAFCILRCERDWEKEKLTRYTVFYMMISSYCQSTKFKKRLVVAGLWLSIEQLVCLLFSSTVYLWN